MQRFCSRGEPITETKTFACCRSPDTSARVTVTPFTRGSRSSNRIVSLATSRIASATRARRCVFMVASSRGPSHVQLVVEQLRDRVDAERLYDLLERLPDVAVLDADHGHAQHHQLPVVQGVDLGTRDVERVPQPVQDDANDLPLI